jgi:hypothetical protein
MGKKSNLHATILKSPQSFSRYTLIGVENADENSLDLVLMD